MPGAGVSPNVSEKWTRSCQVVPWKKQPQAWSFLVTKSSGSLLTELCTDRNKCRLPALTATLLKCHVHMLSLLDYVWGEKSICIIQQGFYCLKTVLFQQIGSESSTLLCQEFQCTADRGNWTTLKGRGKKGQRDFSGDPVGLSQLGKLLKVLGNTAGEINVPLLEKQCSQTLFSSLSSLAEFSLVRIWLSWLFFCSGSTAMELGILGCSLARKGMLLLFRFLLFWDCIVACNTAFPGSCPWEGSFPCWLPVRTVWDLLERRESNGFLHSCTCFPVSVLEETHAA